MSDLGEEGVAQSQGVLVELLASRNSGLHSVERSNELVVVAVKFLEGVGIEQARGRSQKNLALELDIAAASFTQEAKRCRRW